MNELQEIGIQTGHRVALLAMSVVLLGFVLELVRRDMLKERYALFWLATSLFGLLVGIFPDVLVKFAVLVRFQLLTGLFVMGFLFLLGIVLMFTVLISRLSEHNRALAQEVALLSNRLDRIEEDGDE
ncbi:MAG: DUF2304 domain-containing protein [Candidatus Hydrogenedentes bacterium]|jgi:hypothetical protein|nr:DUF2304 domain-containing protein [Candidatus Hydrogenedentota bacterium]